MPQGVVGTMPWNAIAFLTLWLQLLGFTSFSASVLSATFTLGVSAGGFLGGYLGDLAAQWNPNSGRVYTAQASVRPHGTTITIHLLEICKPCCPGRPDRALSGLRQPAGPSHTLVPHVRAAYLRIAVHSCWM